VAIYGEAKQVETGPRLALPSALALIFLSAALIFLGVFPQPLLALIRNLTPGRI
jgi:NADH:ubiquinone oxidoreductase subunit 4 (subunit M)